MQPAGVAYFFRFAPEQYHGWLHPLR